MSGLSHARLNHARLNHARLNHARLARLGRWPRRGAALGCLLLALASAVTARHGPPADAAARHTAANPLGVLLRAGQVATPVTVGGGPATGYLHTGDRVALYATPGGAADPAQCATASGSPIGSWLRVLAVDGSSGGLGGDGTSRLILAVDAVTAARIAALQSCGMLAMLDKDP